MFSAERYFATQLPPPGLEQDVARVREFVQRQAQEGRKVVLVTVCPPFSRLRPHFASVGG